MKKRTDLIKKGMVVGRDVFIHDSVIIRRPHLATIRDHVAIDEFVVITTRLEIGSWVHIGPLISVVGGKKGKFVMKDFTTLSAGCRIICVSDDFAGGTGFINPFVPKEFQSKHKGNTVIMKKHSALGTNVVVFPGVVIGEGAVVGAHSVVTKSLKPWTINTGIPAKSYKKRPQKTILRYEKEIRKKYG